jgi:hypothetical protein
MQDAELEGATQILETQATVIIPSAKAPTQNRQRGTETPVDANRGINAMEIEGTLDTAGEDAQMIGEHISVLSRASRY